jgi:osmotically-inducible protein OsmY
MKNKQIIAAALIALSFAACKKDDTTTTTPPTTGGGTTTTGFTWKEDGGSENKADSAFWTSYTGGAGVRAYKGGMSNFFEINFANSSVGSMSLNTGLTFIKGNSTMTSKTGTVNITSNTSDKLTGNGSATLSGGSIAAVTFTFTDLAKR